MFQSIWVGSTQMVLCPTASPIHVISPDPGLCRWTVYLVAHLSRNSSPNSSSYRIAALAEGAGRRVVSAEDWGHYLTSSLPFHLAVWPPFNFFCLVWAVPAPLLKPSGPSALGKIPTLSWIVQAKGELTFLGTLEPRSSEGFPCLARSGLGGHLETTWKNEGGWTLLQLRTSCDLRSHQRN